VYELGDADTSRRGFNYLPMKSRGTSESDQTRVAVAVGGASRNALTAICRSMPSAAVSLKSVIEKVEETSKAVRTRADSPAEKSRRQR